MNSSLIRIAVMTDVHGNLPALKSALEVIQMNKCDYIFHTGDIIGIGPYTSECLDLLLSIPNLRLTMGNHDERFAFGTYHELGKYFSKEQNEWVNGCLNDEHRTKLREIPFIIKENFLGTNIIFTHYPLDKVQNKFYPMENKPSAEKLDEMFKDYDADLIFYGHSHTPSDISGRARYINPGALGCNKQPVARLIILECNDRGYTIESHSVPYDNSALIEEFEIKNVPDKRFILNAFFGQKSK